MLHIEDEKTNNLFHKSSYSRGDNDNCVEVADLSDLLGGGTHALRDTQNRQEGALPVPSDAFFGFMAGVKMAG